VGGCRQWKPLCSGIPKIKKKRKEGKLRGKKVHNMESAEKVMN